jgi:glycerate 2-kinase
MSDKHHILEAFQQALLAIDPQQAIHKYVQRQGDSLIIASKVWDLNAIDLRLIAVGKAALPMAQAMAKLVGDKTRQAVVITPIGSSAVDLPSSWQVIPAAHPLPDEGSLIAGAEVRQLLTNCTANTVVLVCVSGGATALLVDPIAGLSLADLRRQYQELLASGGDITTMNRVRTSLDRLKGGGLVKLAQPAQVIGLILSDVVGDAIATIGSGLTNHPAAQNILVGNNQQACAAAASYLGDRGYQPRIVTTAIQGEAQAIGREIAQAIVQEAPGKVLIYGGETTVTLPPNCTGRGGRNQELVLAAAMALDDLGKSAWVASMGTDGIDGQSEAAGSIANEQTVAQAEQRGLMAADYLERHDSYNFFQPLAALITTGATGTNVADIVIAVRG